MIRAIIFDCFGVLYSGSLDYLKQLAPPGRAVEVHDINLQKDYGYLSNREYLQALSEILGRPPEVISEIIDQRHIRNPELIALVKKYKADYAIGLLSNVGDSVMDRLFPPSEANELFDAVILSHNEGIVKPHPAIFTLAAERLGVSPGECIMIDDLEENCDGAEIAGMQSIQHITNQRTAELLAQMIKSA